MATTVTLTNVIRTGTDDQAFRLLWSDGIEHEFADLGAMTRWARSLDNKDCTQRLCVAHLLARSADVSNLASVVGKNFTYDPADNSPIKVQ